MQLSWWTVENYKVFNKSPQTGWKFRKHADLNVLEEI